MIGGWTRKDIEAIFMQLDSHSLPFSRYRFVNLGQGLELIGTGASAYVFEAVSRNNYRKKYALKVTGFDGERVDIDAFREQVDFQQSLSVGENYTVEIIAHAELKIWIEGDHDVIKVETHDSAKDTVREENVLYLQFVLMEKLMPVMMPGNLGGRLTVEKLEACNLKEILTLAYDIGRALDKAHRAGVLHRDVKPENIFYDSKHKCYKLGDFGIAGKTENGFAGTVAFTKGYGAPEVAGSVKDKYDCTADIYSFGMLLYVLLNELRFPGAEGYRPNMYQYMNGFTAPEPVNGPPELVKTVMKMIRFDPDDRYQSMEEVLNELDRCGYGEALRYQRRHRETAAVLSIGFTIAGAAMWKLTASPSVLPQFSGLQLLFPLLCCAKGVLAYLGKRTKLVGWAIFGIGLYLLSQGGFTWWKLVVLLILAVFGRHFTGLFGAGVVTGAFAQWALSRGVAGASELVHYRWIAVLLLTLAFVFECLHFLTEERDRFVTAIFLGWNVFWIYAIAAYSMLLFAAGCIFYMQGKTVNYFEVFYGRENVEWFLSWHPEKVGWYGLGFCLFWIARMRSLAYLEGRLEKWREKRN